MFGQINCCSYMALSVLAGKYFQPMCNFTVEGASDKARQPEHFSLRGRLDCGGDSVWLGRTMRRGAPPTNGILTEAGGRRGAKESMQPRPRQQLLHSAHQGLETMPLLAGDRGQQEFAELWQSVEPKQARPSIMLMRY